MIFGTWNVMSIYNAGSLTTVASDVAKYNLHPVAVREVVSQQTIIVHFSVAIPVQNGVNQEVASSPLLCNFSLH